MGIETAIIGGSLLAGAGGILQGRSQQQAGQAAINAQNRRNGQIDALAMQQMTNGPTWEQSALTNALAGGAYNTGQQIDLSRLAMSPHTVGSTATAGINNYNAQGYNAAAAGSQGYNPSTIDYEAFFGGGGGATAAQASVGGFTAKEIAAALAGKPLDVTAEQINVPSITQAVGDNLGNDALMQLLRSDPSKQRIAIDDQMSEMLGTGNPFNTTSLASALRASNSQNMADALAGVQGSNGSLGQRFGSATQQRVADTSRRMTLDNNLLNAQVEQGAFENAQARRMGAANLLSQLEQARRGQTIQAAGLLSNANQAQADLTLRGLLANQSTGMQAQLANQAANLQTDLSNRDALNQIGLANQNAYNQAGMQTQSLGAQVSMANAQLATQAALQNARIKAEMAMGNMGAMNQAGMFGADAANRASLFNAGALNEAGQFNANAFNQAGQFNAGQANQVGMFNATAQNQNNQFNAGTMNDAQRFNINALMQGQQMNNDAAAQNYAQLLQSYGLVNQFRNNQTGLNLQALGIMAGQPMVGPNPAAGAGWGALGDAGQLAAMLGMMQRRPTGATTGAAQTTVAPNVMAGWGMFGLPGMSNFFGAY